MGADLRLLSRGLRIAMIALGPLFACGGELTGWTAGGKSVLIIPVSFTDAAAPAAPAGGWTNTMSFVSNFYRRTSYGASWISSFTVTPTIAMGVSSTNYRPYANWKTTAFLPDVRAKAKLAGFDTDQFDLELVNTRLPSESPVGNAVHGGKGVWMNFTNNHSKFALATAHEFGHNFGLFHTRGFSAANYDVFPVTKNGYWWDEYGGMFDVMGGSPTNPPADFCVYDKSFLGWIPDSLIARPVTSGTFRVHAFDQGVLVASNFLGLTIARDAHNHYWVEFRQAHTNNVWSMNGLLIYWGGEEILASSGAPVQLDMTPGSHGINDPEPSHAAGATIEDGALLLGRTYSDPNVNLHITPVRKGSTSPESLDVVVNFGPFPSNRPPVVAMTATNLAPATNQSVGFSIGASDPDGDVLAYYWEFDDPGVADGTGIAPFGDGTVNPDSTLATNAAHAWATGGLFQARCTVTDMKGGRTTASALVTVAGGGGLLITGVVKDEDGNPIQGAIVNNWKLAATNAVYFGTTNFLASSETASNGQYMLRVRPNSTNDLRAYADGRLFTCDTPGGSQTGTVVVGATSVTNVNFTRVTNQWTISGQVLLTGISRSYNPVIDGPLTITEARSGQSTNVAAGGTWQMSVPGGPVSLSFSSPSNYVIRYGFPNPYEVNDHFNIFTFFVDVPGALSSEGFDMSAASSDGSVSNFAIPVVLSRPAAWTNSIWPPSAWVQGIVDARSTAIYGVDYRLTGTEITFTNNTSVFTNTIALRLLPSAATNSRTIVLRLAGYNSGANIGAISNFTYAIIPPGADADADGLPDWWEWRFAQSLTNVNPQTDADTDGADNRAEYAADTDPFSAASFLGITAVQPQAGGLRVDWQGGTGVTQYVEGTAELVAPAAWTTLFTNPAPTALQPAQVLTPSNDIQFLRIRAQR